MVHAPTCPHEILYKSSVLWRVRPRSRFHAPASANQSRSAAPLTAAFRLTLKASWRLLLAACSVPNDPEPSWTILNLPKNYGKLLWTSDPASTWFPRRRYATPHRLVTYPYLGYGIYVANCSKVKSKTEAAAMTRTGGEMTKGCWLRTHGKKNVDTKNI